MEKERHVAGSANYDRLTQEQVEKKSSATHQLAKNGPFTDIEKLRRENQQLRKDNTALRRMFETSLPTDVDLSNVVFSWNFREPRLKPAHSRTVSSKTRQRCSSARGRLCHVFDSEQPGMFQLPTSSSPCCYDTMSTSHHPHLGITDGFPYCIQPTCQTVGTPFAPSADTIRQMASWDWCSRGRNLINDSFPPVSNDNVSPRQTCLVGRRQSLLRVPSSVSALSMIARNLDDDPDQSAGFHDDIAAMLPQYQAPQHQLPQHRLHQYWLPQYQLPQHPYESWPGYASTTLSYAQPRAQRQFRLIETPFGGSSSEAFPGSLLSQASSQVAPCRGERQPIRTANIGRSFSVDSGGVATHRGPSTGGVISSVPTDGLCTSVDVDGLPGVNDDILAWAVEGLFSESREGMVADVGSAEELLHLDDPANMVPEVGVPLPQQLRTNHVKLNLLSADENTSANDLERASNATDVVERPTADSSMAESGSSLRVSDVDVLNIVGNRLENDRKTKSKFFASVDMVGNAEKQTKIDDCVEVLTYAEVKKCLNEETLVEYRRQVGDIPSESSYLVQETSATGFSNSDRAESWNDARQLANCKDEDRGPLSARRSSPNYDTLGKARDKDGVDLKINNDLEDEHSLNGKVCVEKVQGVLSGKFQGNVLPDDDMHDVASSRIVRFENGSVSLRKPDEVAQIAKNAGWKSVDEVTEYSSNGLNHSTIKSNESVTEDKCYSSPSNSDSTDKIENLEGFDDEDGERLPQTSKRQTPVEGVIDPKRFKKSTDDEDHPGIDEDHPGVCEDLKYYSSCVVGLCIKDCKKRRVHAKTRKHQDS